MRLRLDFERLFCFFYKKSLLSIGELTINYFTVNLAEVVYGWETIYLYKPPSKTHVTHGIIFMIRES